MIISQLENWKPVLSSSNLVICFWILLSNPSFFSGLGIGILSDCVIYNLYLLFSFIYRFILANLLATRCKRAATRGQLIKTGRFLHNYTLFLTPVKPPSCKREYSSTHASNVYPSTDGLGSRCNGTGCSDRRKPKY